MRGPGHANITAAGRAGPSIGGRAGGGRRVARGGGRGGRGHRPGARFVSIGRRGAPLRGAAHELLRPAAASRGRPRRRVAVPVRRRGAVGPGLRSVAVRARRHDSGAALVRVRRGPAARRGRVARPRADGGRRAAARVGVPRARRDCCSSSRGGGGSGGPGHHAGRVPAARRVRRVVPARARRGRRRAPPERRGPRGRRGARPRRRRRARRRAGPRLGKRGGAAGPVHRRCTEKRAEPRRAARGAGPARGVSRRRVGRRLRARRRRAVHPAARALRGVIEAVAAECDARTNCTSGRRPALLQD